jgi:hypothetical protein
VLTLGQRGEGGGGVLQVQVLGLRVGFDIATRRGLAEHRQRASLEFVGAAGRDRRESVAAGSGRIELDFPFGAIRSTGQGEGDRLVIGIEQDEEHIVLHRPAPLVALIHDVAVQQQADAADQAVRPLLVVHLQAIRAVPLDVLDLVAPDGPSLEEGAAMEDRVLLAQRDQPLGEAEQLALVPIEIPVEPADRVILAVGVVVPALGAPPLVAGDEHRHAL